MEEEILNLSNKVAQKLNLNQYEQGLLCKVIEEMLLDNGTFLEDILDNLYYDNIILYNTITNKDLKNEYFDESTQLNKYLLESINKIREYYQDNFHYKKQLMQHYNKRELAELEREIIIDICIRRLNLDIFNMSSENIKIIKEI